jgi:VWFA-related protein
VLFIDTLHLSPLSVIRVKKVLKQFIDEQITDDDLVAIVVTAGSLGVLQQFMRDRKMLKYAIDKITLFGRGQSLFTPYLAARVTSEDERAIEVAIQILVAEEGYVSINPRAAREYAILRARQIIGQETYFRKATLATLRAVCDRLAEMPGQRMVFMMTDGFTILEDRGGAENDIVRAVTGRASRSGVVIYSLDAKGLTVPAEYRASTPSIASNVSLEFSSIMALSETDQQQVLRTLSSETGGEAFLNHNDLDRPLQKALDNNCIYYAIAYYPADGGDRKKLRNVTIRVKSHPEYKVRAQKGYFPIETSSAEATLTARQKLIKNLLSPLPVTAIGVTSSASYFESAADAAQVSLQVHFEGRSLEYRRQERDHLINCEVLGTMFDSSGKMISNFSDAVRATLTPEQMEQGKKSGYHYGKRLSLKPGFYQIRVGVRDQQGELSGTSSCWVEVPDLRKGKPALSSIYLGKEQKEQKGESRPRLIPGKASFKSGDTAFYRFVTYNTDAQGAMIRVEIVRGEEAVYQGEWQPLASRSIRGDRRGMEAGGQLALGLDPGVYELRVMVKDAKSKKAIEQAASFEVEP